MTHTDSHTISDKDDIWAALRLVADARERRLYAPQRAGHASLPGSTALLVSELLQLLVLGAV